MSATAREFGMPRQTVKTIGLWLHHYQTTGIVSDPIRPQLNGSGTSRKVDYSNDLGLYAIFVKWWQSVP